MHPYIAFKLITSPAHTVKRADEPCGDDFLAHLVRAIYSQAIRWLRRD